MSTATPSPELIALAERLVVLRGRTGLRQYEVAALLQIRAASLSDFERARAEPSLFQALALADLYTVSLDVLTSRAALPAPPQVPPQRPPRVRRSGH